MPINRNPQSKPFLYRTTDAGLAAALMALGFDLIRLEEREQGVYFTFAASPMIFEATDGYKRGTLTVSAKRMSETMQVLDLAVWDQKDLEKL